MGRRSSGFYVQLCYVYAKCSVSSGEKVSDQQRLGWSGKILYEVSGAVNRMGRSRRIWVKEELWLGGQKEDFQRKGLCKQRASIWEVVNQFWASLIAVGKESTCNAGDPCSIPGLGRSAGEGIGYPLQFSEGLYS